MENSLSFIADAWRFFKKNLVSIITLIMPLVMPVSIFLLLLPTTQEMLNTLNCSP